MLSILELKEANARFEEEAKAKEAEKAKEQHSDINPTPIWSSRLFPQNTVAVSTNTSNSEKKEESAATARRMTS